MDTSDTAPPEAEVGEEQEVEEAQEEVSSTEEDDELAPTPVRDHETASKEAFSQVPPVTDSGQVPEQPDELPEGGGSDDDTEKGKSSKGVHKDSVYERPMRFVSSLVL